MMPRLRGAVLLLALALVLLPSCQRSERGPTQAAASQTAKAKSPTGQVVFRGMCDASGAVPLSETTFLVADDEDNTLRAYDAERGGPPLWSVEVSSGIGISPRKKKGPAEADIEAATTAEGLAFWITSHGRNSSGKHKDERFRLFATTLATSADRLTVVGRPYQQLLDDILSDPRFTGFGLEAAAALAPKAPGGLNLEGMTARVEGGVWLGFRNPKPSGRALVFALLNPRELVEQPGARGKLGDPVLLDLKGHGVRALSRSGNDYLIVAGPHDGTPSSQLYLWDGKGQPRPAPDFSLQDFNPEGFFSPVGAHRFMLLSDDGGRSVGGIECKRLPEAARKSFRGQWLEL